VTVFYYLEGVIQSRSRKGAHNEGNSGEEVAIL
jgi:hypothetical protein